MNTYLFTSQNAFQMCGYQGNDPLGWSNTSVEKLGTRVTFFIPEGLNITSAKVVLCHAPISWIWTDAEGNSNNFWGYCRKLKLYKTEDINAKIYTAEYGSECSESDNTTYEEIVGALGTDGWSPTEPTSTSHKTENVTSIDIKSSITSGLNEIVVQPSDAATQTWNGHETCKRTAFIYAMIKIDGYMSYE